MVDLNGEFALPVAIALLASTWAWNREVTANRAEGLTGWDAFSIDNVNIRPIIEPWAMLGAGYVGGAAIGALGFTGRTALAAGAVTDIGASYLWNTQVNGSYSATDLLFDAAFFGMGEYIGYRGVRNAGSSSYGPSPQDFRQARNIIGARRAEAIGGGRFDIRMELGDNVGGTSPYFIRVATDEYGYTIPYPSVDTWNMVKTAKTIQRTTHGGIRDPKNFWRTWQRDFPETLSERNRRFLKAKSSPQVDDVWIQHFPEMSLYKGQTLVHHHVDLGRYAIPLPENLHGRGGIEPFLAGSGIDPYTVWHPRELGIRAAMHAFRKENREW